MVERVGIHVNYRAVSPVESMMHTGGYYGEEEEEGVKHEESS